MRSQFLPLLGNELAKTARRKLPYFGLLSLALLCVVVFFVGGEISNTATTNAWGYVGFSMQIIFTDIGPILLVVFSALLIAEETGVGTIRAALAAPVHRWEFYLAKAVAGLIYMLAFSAAALIFCCALGTIHYHFGPIGDSFGVVYSQTRALQQLLTAFALSWIPLSALVMYGLLVSTLIRSPGAAVAVGISTLFLIDFTKHLVGLDPYIFTKYLTYSWLNLQQVSQGMDFQWRPEVWKMVTLCVESALATFTTGLVIFVKQDLNH